MDGGDWARSRALMVPRDTCRAANVRMRAQMSKEGGGVPGETGNATRKGCRFATLGEAPWSRLISAQIGVERPLQFERTSPQHDPRGLLPAESACWHTNDRQAIKGEQTAVISRSC